MNALRATTYPPTRFGTPDSFSPFTIVIRECDLEAPIAQATMDYYELGDEEGAFSVVEVFDIPDDATIEDASVLAIEQQVRDAEERYMACLYYFEANAFAHTHDEVTMLGTIPAPIDAEDVAFALRRLAKHPGYVRQTVVMPSQDGRVVRLVRGEIKIEEVAA